MNETMASNPAVLLIGPTASGKTALACALADRFPVDIISVDSAMVYRGMDIGTAKPDAAMQARYPHHLIDLVTPEESYSAALFCFDAHRQALASWGRGRIPLLTGGTMLYVRALLEGLSTIPVANLETRAEIDAEASRSGWPAMHRELARVDPQTAARLMPNDAQRISRALEVFRSSGTPLSEWHALKRPSNVLFRNTLKIGLMPADRPTLHARIALRFVEMLDRGLIEEVEGLLRRFNLKSTLPSMRSVGYRQVLEHLNGDTSQAEMGAKAIAATRQLAKRQMTWMRSMPDLELMDSVSADISAPLIRRVAEFLESNAPHTG